MKTLVFTYVPNETLQNQIYERYQNISTTHTYEELFEIAKRNLLDGLYSMNMFASVIKSVKEITLEDYLLYEFLNKNDLEKNINLNTYNAMMSLLESEIKYLLKLKDEKIKKENDKWMKFLNKVRAILRF